MAGYVYIMANKRYGTIYVGVTSDIVRRVWEHKNDVLPGFTRQYGLHALVYFEVAYRIEGAIQREKNIKHWPRRWKTEMIDGMNSEWEDLYPGLM